jgi:hypothetical protein
MRLTPQTIPAPGAGPFYTAISTFSLRRLAHNAG